MTELTCCPLDPVERLVQKIFYTARDTFPDTIQGKDLIISYMTNSKGMDTVHKSGINKVDEHLACHQPFTPISALQNTENKRDSIQVQLPSLVCTLAQTYLHYTIRITDAARRVCKRIQCRGLWNVSRVSICPVGSSCLLIHICRRCQSAEASMLWFQQDGCRLVTMMKLGCHFYNEAPTGSSRQLAVGRAFQCSIIALLTLQLVTPQVAQNRPHTHWGSIM